MKKNDTIQTIINDVKIAENLLQQYMLLYDMKGISNDCYSVKSSSNPCFDKKNNSNIIYWENNIENYTFKLVDNSIICFKFEIQNNDIVKANINYISGSFVEHNYNEISYMISNEELENIKDYEINDYEDYLIKEYLNRLKVSYGTIENILKLNRNRIIIRLDIDVYAVKEKHPEIHLTINNMKNSRFKVNRKYIISDFVCFILDIIYGIKINGRQGIIFLKE